MKYWQIDENIHGMLLTIDIPFESRHKYGKQIMKIFDKAIVKEQRVKEKKRYSK